MILADKIILLRKKNNWSQEQLAEQLGISRQSVSKWESGASIPDLDKIVKMSHLLGVSTDYLLKDELEELQYAGEEELPKEDEQRYISVEEANAYMELSEKSAKSMAVATLLLILSPVCLLLLGGFAEYSQMQLSENAAGGLGLIILFLMIIAGVGIFIWKGMQLDKYEYIEKEDIALAYGVQGIVEKKRDDFETVNRGCTTAGTALCIAGVIPLLAAGAFELSDLTLIGTVALLLVFEAVGVYLFVWSGTISGSYKKLLQEGDYTRKEKEFQRRTGHFGGIYWCVVTAVYLCMLLPDAAREMNWRDSRSWVIWPVAGVLYGAVRGLLKMIVERKAKQ